MTNKVRENFFILLGSNICTIVLVIILLRIYNDQKILDFQENTLTKIVSLTGITILCVMVISILWAILRHHTNTEIVINNNVNPVVTNNHSHENAEKIREKHRLDRENERTARMKAVIDYTYNILSPFLTDDCLDILSKNIKLFEIPGSSLTAISTNGKLSTLDIKH